MFQHQLQQGRADDALLRVRQNKVTAAKLPLPLLYPATRNHFQFFAYKQAMLSAFDAVDLTEIVNGRLRRDGPNPAPPGNVNVTNEITFDTANQTIYNMLVRTFTAENHGFADAVSIAPGQGFLLYQHLVNLNEGLMATKIDDTQDTYNHAK